MIASTMLAAMIAAAPRPEPSQSSLPAPTAAPGYLYLTDDENWKSFCSTANRSANALDALKCIQLGSDSNDYLTLGADLRAKYEHFFNKDGNAGNSGYLLERELLDIDLHEGRLRGFVQLEHATATDEHAPIDATWRADFASTSAYAQYNFGGATGARQAPFELRVGRQLLAYGSERMIDDRSGLNTLQPFDGIRARFHTGGWQTDAFYVRPFVVEPYSFDNLANSKSTFSGIYATRHIGSDTFDLYGLVDQRGRRSIIVVSDPRSAIRSACATPRLPRCSTPIPSSTSSTVTQPVPARRWRRDRVGRPRSQEFVLLAVPCAIPDRTDIRHHRGQRQREHVRLHPKRVLHIPSKSHDRCQRLLFYRQSAVDGVYSAPGYPLRAPEGSDAPPLGNLGYVSVVDALDRHVSLYTAYARYAIGQYLKATPENESSPSRSTAYYNLWFDIKI